MQAGYLVLFYLLGLTLGHGAPYEANGLLLKSFYSCNGYLAEVGTFCNATDPYFGYGTCLCGNKNARASFAGCLTVDDRYTPSLVKKIAHMCSEVYFANVTVEEFDQSLKYYKTHAKEISEIPGYNFTVAVDVPIKINETRVTQYNRGYDQFLDNYDHSLYYGAGAIGFWALVLLIATIVNVLKSLTPKLYMKTTNPVTNWFRSKILLPAIHRRKTEAKPLLGVLDCLVPSRLESLIIGSFCVFLIGVLAANIRVVPDDPIFLQPSRSIARQIAVRSGITLTCFMPLLILFAGRNNFLQWTTGWNFATFILYHRWIGRLAFILVTIHGIGYSLAFKDSYYVTMKDTYVIWGMFATVAGGFIIVQGLLVLRRAWYEVFLLIHIILAAFFIAGAWIHVDELGYVWFYYACSAVWIFDRAVRIGRLIVFGFPNAHVALVSGETVKVVVSKPSHWKSVPGGHAFVHFLRLSCFWQSHPFTFTERVETGDCITLYCKIKGGVTHGLYQYLANQPGRTARIRVAVEGPYGSPTNARHYDTSVFIAGGNGIPGIYSEAYDLAIKSANKVKLMWIIRDTTSLEWFTNELQDLKGKNILPIVYITKPEVSESSDSDEKKQPNSKINGCNFEKELPHVEFRYGRPQLEDIVKQEIEESAGSTCFVTCGHPMMVDDLRYIISTNLHPKKRVEFFEQLQVWA